MVWSVTLCAWVKRWNIKLTRVDMSITWGSRIIYVWVLKFTCYVCKYWLKWQVFRFWCHLNRLTGLNLVLSIHCNSVKMINSAWINIVCMLYVMCIVCKVHSASSLSFKIKTLCKYFFYCLLHLLVLAYRYRLFVY